MPTRPSPTLPAGPRLRMPAEWEPHAATWIAWPHFHGDWPGKFEPIPWVYAEIVRHLARHERVEIIVNDAVSEKAARRVLKLAHAAGVNIGFHRWRTNRVWTRDSGCTFVLSDGQPRVPPPPSAKAAAIKWRFNAWAKYSNWRHDDKIGSLMAKSARLPAVRARFAGRPFVLEGGSIDVNGLGTLLTTEECLLGKTQQRNPGLSKADYESVFSAYLGVSNIIWLGVGIAGDDTHGHVDDLARFVSADTVVTVVESNPRDVNYQPLKQNLKRLRQAKDQNGKSLNVVELPMPRPVTFNRVRLPASYANFYIANRQVIVPVFNDPNDRHALDILASAFPEREVTGIYCGDLVWGFGTLHCLTQQQPALPM